MAALDRFHCSNIEYVIMLCLQYHLLPVNTVVYLLK